MLTGIKEVVLTLRVALPPGVTEEQGAQFVLNGVSLSATLTQYARGLDVNIVDAAVAGPQLL